MKEDVCARCIRQTGIQGAGTNREVRARTTGGSRQEQPGGSRLRYLPAFDDSPDKH